MVGKRGRLTPFLLPLAASSFFLAGCALPHNLLSGSGGATPEASTSTPLPSSQPPTPSPTVTHELEFGLGASGTTVTIPLHQVILVALPALPMGPWARLTDSAPLVLAPGTQLLPPTEVAGAQQESFLAVAPGRAVIRSILAPACTHAHPACELADRLFSLTVVVSS